MLPVDRWVEAIRNTMCSEGRSRAILLVTIWISCLAGSAQELQGRFYAEKHTYMVGEPVLFNMEIKNTVKEVVYVNAKDPGKCLDRYEFSVSGTSSGCGAKWDAECRDEQSPVLPGESYRGQWPLNFWYQFERDGKYAVSATRHIPVRSVRGEFQDFAFSSKFAVNLKPTDSVRVQSILQEFERNLHSSDPDIRHAALDVLATTAPS